MRIALVGGDYCPLPAKKYGGIERHIVWLAQELIKKNHEVTVFSHPDSQLACVKMRDIKSLSEASAQLDNDIDIYHFHNSLPKSWPKPMLSTLHGNLPENTFIDTPNTVCLSQNHAERHGRSTFVYNGLPIDDYVFSEKKSDYLLFLARVGRKVKGIRKTLDLANRLQFNLKVAGGSRFELRRTGGLVQSMRPYIHFCGEIDDLKKQELLSNAKALLAPINYHEPFGLVVIEALISGTPVITSPLGSMRELINPTVGFLCQNDEDYIDAIENIASLSPKDCRDYAAENFSMEQCTDNYLKLYERVLNGESLG